MPGDAAAATTASLAVHCIALLDASSTTIARGALDAEHPGDGIRLLRSTTDPGYVGLMPLAIGTNTNAVDSAQPRRVLAAATGVLACGRLDGFSQRT